MVWNDEEVHCMQLSRSKTGIGYWGRVDKWGGNMGGSAQQQQGWSGLEREGAFWEYVGEMVVESLTCPTPGKVGGSCVGTFNRTMGRSGMVSPRVNRAVAWVLAAPMSRL